MSVCFKHIPLSCEKDTKSRTAHRSATYLSAAEQYDTSRRIIGPQFGEVTLWHLCIPLSCLCAPNISAVLVEMMVLYHTMPCTLTGATNVLCAIVKANSTHTRSSASKNEWKCAVTSLMKPHGVESEQRLWKRAEKKHTFPLNIPHSALIGAFVNNP